MVKVAGAQTSQEHLIASPKGSKLYLQGDKENWCGPSLRLRLEGGVHGEVSKSLIKVAELFAAKCPALQNVRVTVGRSRRPNFNVSRAGSSWKVANSNNSPTEAEAVSQVEAPANRNSILSTMGKLEDGTIVVPSLSTADEALSKQLKVLRRLLMLSAKPELVEAPTLTHLFAEIMPQEVDVRYRTAPYAGAKRESWTWKGQDEFTREDMRTKFVTEQSTTLVAMAPKFPFQVTEVRPIKLGNYDKQEGAFEIEQRAGRDEALAGANAMSIRLPRAKPLPAKLRADDQTARRMLEALRTMQEAAGLQRFPGSDRWAVLVSKFWITGARVQGMEIYLDAQLLSVDVRAGRITHVGEKLAVLYQGAARAGEGGALLASDQDAKTSYLFDKELPRLFAAKHDVDRALTQDFWRSSAEIRRGIERIVSQGEPGFQQFAKSSWNLHFSELVTGSQVELSEQDLDGYREWTLRRLKLLPQSFRVEPQGILLESGAVSPRRVLENMASSSSTSARDIVIEAAKDAYPQAIDVVVMEGQPEFSTAFVLRQSPHWEGVEVDVDRAKEAYGGLDGYSEFSVVSSKLVWTVDKKPVVLLEVAPLGIHVRGKDGADLVQSFLREDNTKEPDADASASRFDIVGIRLGQHRAQALELAKSAFESAVYATESAGSQDGLFAAGDWLTEQTDKYLKHQIVVLYDPRKTEQVVGSVLRYLPTSVPVQTMTDALVQKFGAPDYQSCDKWCFLVWAERPATKAALKRKGYEFQTKCALYPPRGYNPQSSMSNSGVYFGEVSVPCGAFLSAFINDGFTQFILANADDVVALRALKARSDKDLEAQRAKEMSKNVPKL